MKWGLLDNAEKWRQLMDSNALWLDISDYRVGRVLEMEIKRYSGSDRRCRIIHEVEIDPATWKQTGKFYALVGLGGMTFTLPCLTTLLSGGWITEKNLDAYLDDISEWGLTMRTATCPATTTPPKEEAPGVVKEPPHGVVKLL